IYCEIIRWIECNLVLDPASVDGWAHLSRFLYYVNLEGVALSASTRTLALAPENPLALEHYSVSLLLVGEAVKAKDTVEKWRAKSAGFSPDLCAGWAAWMSRDYERADQLLKESLEKAPNSLFARELRAKALEARQRFDEATAEWALLVEEGASEKEPDVGFRLAADRLGEY